MRIFRRMIGRLWGAYRRLIADDGPRLAAAMAYYVALALFPLLMVLVAGLSFVMASTTAGHDAQHRLLTVIEQQTSPALGEQVERVLAAVNRQALVGGPVGFLLLFVTAVAIFVQFGGAFDRIWQVTSDPHKNWRSWVRGVLVARFKALVMLIGVGAFVIAVVITSVVWAGIQSAVAETGAMPPLVRWAIGLATNVGLNWLAFTAIYRYVPQADVPWPVAAQGGAVAALLWEVGRQLLAAYLVGGRYLTAYGIIGSFIAIMIWIYYAMIVIFYGAEYARAISEESGTTPTR